jgi:hypothetical protein
MSIDGDPNVVGHRSLQEGHLVNPLVEFVLRHPGLADRLIAEHFDDGRGYCRACGLGAQRGFHRFPCDIRRTADTAKELEARGPGNQPPDNV